MLIQNESEILKEEVRIKIIEEMNLPENKQRKDEMYMRYEVYKDRTWKYVVAKMLAMLDMKTVQEMAYAISNISICKKIISKLARVYANGVERTVVDANDKPNEDLTKQVQKLAKILNFNSAMKKTNRAYKRDKNTMFYVRPIKINDKYDLKPMPLYPYQYDVVEQPDDREKALCVIISHYAPPQLNNGFTIQTETQAGFHGQQNVIVMPGNNKDEKIADTPSDQDAEKNQIIWWSDSYHFMTDNKGRIISEDTDNPIGKMPFVNFAEDQDGAFWANGGEDIINGSVLVNSVNSHNQHVGIIQGYGQMYMTGKNLPKGLKIGPTNCIQLEFDSAAGEIPPQIGFLSASPQLAELRNNISQYVALLLSTNNLSVSSVATQLAGGMDFPSGIAMILDKAESMEDVNDQQQVFHDNEPEIWRLIAAWINLFKAKNLLSERLMEFTLPEDIVVSLKFPDQHPIVSEADKVDTLQKRKDLGINTTEELIMLDDPNLTKEQAKEKAALLKQNKEMAIEEAAGVNENDQGPGNTNKDNIDAGAGPGEGASIQ